MNQDMILIDFDPFAKESRIIVIENGQRGFVNVSSDINELAKQIPTYCEQYKLFNVKFHAPVNAFYELKHQLEEIEKQTYGENKINLEIG